MLKCKLALGIVTGLAYLFFPSCGNDSDVSIPPRPDSGALYTYLSDTPVCDVLSFRMTVTGLKLKFQGKTDTREAFPSPSRLVKVNYASLRDFATILNLASVEVGTYDEAQFGFSAPQLILWDPSQTPPVRTQFARLPTSPLKFPIRPPLTITKDKIAALRIDFDMLRSIQVDAQGQITGDVTPVFKATPVAVTTEQGLGEFDDLVGFIRTVSPFPTGEKFIGAFNLQLLAGTGPAISVNLTEESELVGVPDLNLLETGRIAEVHATVDEKGNVVAKSVQIEDRAVVEDKKLAFLGYVTSVTRDASGNVTQFSLYVREEEPDISLDVFLDSILTVNVKSTTTFGLASTSTNFPNLPFNAAAIAPGQELIVHGVYTKPEDEDQPVVVDANSIYLKLQTIQGNFSSLVQVGSDGKTGAFWLTSCATLLQGAPILVMTNADTAFLNVFGLAQLTPQPTLLVRGLPFYQTQAGTINGVAVPAGTLVVTARQVHQRQ